MAADKAARRARRKKTKTEAGAAEPWREYLLPGVEITPERIAYAKNRVESDRIGRSAFRKIVNFYEVHKYCPRAACRRARTCVHPQVACFYEALPVLRERVFPQLKKALAERVKAIREE